MEVARGAAPMRPGVCSSWLRSGEDGVRIERMFCSRDVAAGIRR